MVSRASLHDARRPIAYPARHVPARYPTLAFDLQRDAFVVWLRWVSMEQPPSPELPANQGMRVELQINRNPVYGPTVVFRRDLDQPLWMRCNATRVREVLRKAGDGGTVDLTLIIHGSVANAPYAALFLLQDYEGEAIDSAGVKATPLLQVQPSTPGDQWHVAAQANLRTKLKLENDAVRLHVVRD